MTPLRQRFIEEMQLDSKRPSTIKTYVEVIYDVARTFMRCPSTLSDEEIRMYLLECKNARKNSSSTIHQKKYALKYFYKRIFDRVVPVLQNSKIKVIQALPALLEYSEVKRLIAKVRKKDCQVFLLTVYCCGLRGGEGVKLHREDIDLARRKLAVRDGKGGKHREVPLPQRLCKIYADYFEKHPDLTWIFPSPIKIGFPRNICTFSRALKLAAEDAGIHKKLVLHSLRHSIATHLLERGLSIRTVQLFLGHADISTTMRYNRYTQEGIQALGLVANTLCEELFSSDS